MKKFLHFLALAAMLCIPWVTQAQETLTVHDGSATNSNVPVWGLWADNSLQCEIVYPATELEELTGGVISALKFYTSSTSTNIGTASASSNWDGTFTIFLKEVAATTLSAFTGTTDATTVLTAQIGVVNGEMTIEFTTPYTYNGGNLLVGIYYATGGHYSSVTWKGESVSGASVYGRSGQSYSATQGNFIPKTTFTYTPGATSCEKPTTFVVSNLSAHGATLTWTGGSGTYNVEIMGGSYADWTPYLTSTPLLTTDLTGLDAATDYQVRVQSVCGGETSFWKSANFTTECDVISTFPWTMDFDSYVGTTVSSTNNLPICWEYINTSTYSSYKGYPVVYNASASSYSGNNHLRFSSYYSSYSSYDPQPQYAILPQMSGLDSKRIKLYARGGSATSTFKIGRMTDPADAATFVAITEQALTTGYQEFTYNLTGTGNYIAIMIDAANSTRTSNSVYIDDITVEEIPSCMDPSDLQFVSSTTTEATLSWTAGGSETAWDIYYNTTGVAPTASTAPMVNATPDNPATITGLTPANTYYVWVRAHCSDADQSPWMGGIHFNTACEAITVDADHHYTQNFDNYTGSTSTTAPTGYPDDELPLCWQFLNRSDNSSTYPMAFISSNSGYPVSGNCLFFKSSSTTPLYAILPEFTTDIADLMLTFTYRNEGVSASNGTLYVSYMTDPTDATTFSTADAITCEQTTTLTEKEVFFANAPAGSRIAFKYQGGTSQNYYLSIDNVFVEPAPTCRKPSGLMLNTPSDRTAHTATLKWTDGEAGQTAWQIAYSTDADFDPYSVTPVDVTANPATLTGLEQSTTYYAYVRANCGVDGYSAWCTNKATFTTLAGNNAPTGLAYDPASLTSSAVTLSWTGNTDNDLHASYELYYDLATVTEVPATPAAPNYITGITATEYTLTGLAAETQYKVWVRDNCGTDGYSAWTSSSNSTFTTASLCQTPDGSDITASNITNASATITWNTFGQSGFNLRYSGDNGTTWTTVTDATTPYSLTGLNGNTTYSVQVQAQCDLTEWSATSMTFTTKCDPITTFPWNEDFEGYASGNFSDPCWVNEHLEGSGSQIFKVYTSTNAGNSTHQLQLPDQSAGTLTKLMLPGMTLPNNNYMLSIDVYRSNSTYNAEYASEGIRVFVSTDGEIAGATELTFIPRNYNVASGLIPAEADLGWYTYELPLGISGTCYIILRGESRFCTSTYMDNFVVKEIPSCVKPTLLEVTATTTTTATLSWTENGTATAWQICLNGDETNLIDANSNPFTLDGLTAATTYTAKVRAYCDATDQSDWSTSVNFNTECDIITTFPWTENFDSHTGTTSGTTNNLPNCWNYINTTSYSSYKGYPVIYNASSASHSGNNHLRFYSYYASYGSYDPKPQYAVLPQMDGLDSKRIKLYARGSSTTSTFKIGRMTNPADASTFVAITEQALTTTYQEFTYILTGGTGNYIAIMIDAASSTRSTNSVYIDDITVEEIPSCMEPSDLVFVSSTTTSATLSWTAGGTETAWQICLNGDEANPIDANSNPFTINSLTPSTSYTAKVRAYCSAADQSPWSNEIDFATECEPYIITATEPYTQDFESPVVTSLYNSTTDLKLPTCWENPYTTGSTDAGKPHLVATGASYNYSTSQVLLFYGSGYNFVTLPEFINDLNTLQISFKWATESTTNGTLTLGYITDADNGTYNTFTAIKSYPASSSSYHTLIQAEPVKLNVLPSEASRIVFRWYYSGQYSCNIDDLEVSLIPQPTRDIEANKWYAIATPTHNHTVPYLVVNEVTNLTSGAYDLYRYDEATGTWENSNEAGFDELEVGRGYLYRTDADVTLEFMGDFTSGDQTYGITNSCVDDAIAGFNLLGNPYDKAYTPTMAYYTLGTNGIWASHTANADAVGVAEGFLVYTDADATYAFTEPTGAKRAPVAMNDLRLTVTNGEYTDVAYALFNGGQSLPKIAHLNGEAPMLIIPVGGRDYAIASLDNSAERFPVSFRGKGVYTLTVDNSADYSYLHLVDLVEGTDVDLLRQPEYTFNAGGRSDRFVVKLAPSLDEEGNVIFVRVSDGKVIVEGSGELQVFDVMGRLLTATSVDGTTTFDRHQLGMSHSGVYVLRLGGNSQKIVVK